MASFHHFARVSDAINVKFQAATSEYAHLDYVPYHLSVQQWEFIRSPVHFRYYTKLTNLIMNSNVPENWRANWPLLVMVKVHNN
jgi:hypothetical protein